MVDLAVGDVVHFCNVGPMKITNVRVAPASPNPMADVVFQHLVYIDAVLATLPEITPGTPEAAIERIRESLGRRCERYDGVSRN